MALALARGPVVLDGGLSTELERGGHDVSGALWSARLLRDDPGAVLAAHLAFARAGARVATTATYQASYEGFAAAGVDAAGTTALLERAVALARAATDQAAGEQGTTGQAAGRHEAGGHQASGHAGGWVAASVGPYGAVLADGSEYTGAYAAELGVRGLRRFHHRRLAVLAAAGADVLACETVPALAEAEALVAEVDALGVPAWLSLTTVAGPDGQVLTRRGEDARQAFALARGVDAIVAVGVNCTDPQGLDAAVALAARASGKPVVAYPNSGETWDAAGRTWRGNPHLPTGTAASWVAAGARLVGGCCRVGPDQIAGLAAALPAGTPPPAP